MFQGKTERDNPRFAWAVSLILDYKMTEHFGGPSGGAGAVSEVEFQRHLLCYEAEAHAADQQAKKPPETPTSSSGSGNTTVTNTTRRKRAPLGPAE